MANVAFKRGLQANLKNDKIVEGSFYLTTDSHRLYYGIADNTEPILLNQTVQIVDKVSKLPGNSDNLNGYKATNDFYYCKDENILAVFNGTEWVQINPDTNTNNDTYVTAESNVSAGAVGTDDITYKITLKQKTKDVIKGGTDATVADVTFNLVITKDQIESIIHDPASVGLDITPDNTNKKVTIATQGTGSNSANGQKVVIAGGSNVTISGTDGGNTGDDTITIAATDTTYSLGTFDVSGNTEAKLRLKNNIITQNQDISFKAGDGLTIEGNGSNTNLGNSITYAHATYTKQNDGTNTESLSHAGTFEAITDVTSDNGHVTKLTKTTFTLPADKHHSSVTNSNDEDWKVVLEGEGVNDLTIDFSTDAANLQAVLEEKISDGLAAANTALTYQGTISSYSDLEDIDEVEIGDVYLLSTNDSSGTIKYRKGDMFIATVKKNGTHTGGVIAADSIEWTYVPSGDELNTDTLFKGDVAITSGDENVGKVEYTWSASRGADDNGNTPAMPSGHEDLTIKAGKDINIGGSNAEAIINHKTYNNVTPGTATENITSMTAITELTLSNGHITGISTGKITPTVYTLSGSDNKIKLTNTQSGDCGTVTAAGDNWITAAISNNQLSIQHKTPQTTVTTKSVTNGTLTHGGTLNILTGVKYDGTGHVTDVTTGSVTLPADNNTTYDMFVGNASTSEAAYSSTTASANPYLILRNNVGANDYVQIKGDNGSLAVEAKSSEIQVSMVWGSFDS